MLLQPLDVLVVLKLAATPSAASSYAGLAASLGVSSSQAHSATRRAQAAHLLSQSLVVRRSATFNMLGYGVRYFIPASLGVELRGMPTSYGVEPLKELFGELEGPPVWPLSGGSARGASVEPIYRTVPLAAQHDAKLYSLLAIVDAIRVGRAREREAGIAELEKFFGVGE